MNILILGGSGFIGSYLINNMEDINFSVFTRNFINTKKKFLGKNINILNNWDDLNKFNFDAIINLAGSPINKRWTNNYKENLIKSRVETTSNLIKILSNMEKTPKVLINASAIGYYGSYYEDIAVDEDSVRSASFIGDLCYRWEQMAEHARNLGIRIILARFGVVLGKGGGMLSQIEWPFRFGLGGKIGEGNQIMSWIHIKDLMEIIKLCLNDQTIAGPINFTSPNAVSNFEFTKTFAKILNRPAFLNIPAPIIEILFGEMGRELLLKGVRVMPKKLTEYGYNFKYPEIKMALNEIYC